MTMVIISKEEIGNMLEVCIHNVTRTILIDEDFGHIEVGYDCC